MLRRCRKRSGVSRFAAGWAKARLALSTKRTIRSSIAPSPAPGQVLTSCFTAGTPLLTPDGGKPIEQFRRGDRILARSEDNPEAPVEVKMVEETFVRVSPIVNLRVRGQEIRTTTEHPIYVRGKGWICARELKAGDELSSHDGQWVAVEAVTDLNEVATVYNLRVSDYHTYFVGSREWGFSVWAHNANYVVVPYRDGFRLYQVGENGAFTVVNSAGTTTPRYFATRQLAQEAVESGGGALISNNLNRFSRASEFGIQPAGRLRSQTAHTGLETHHLIEQRFAETL